MSDAERGRLLRVHGFEPVGGYCFAARLPADIPLGDSAEDPYISGLTLLENGLAIGPPHATHSLIRERGGGLFSHWHDVLYFSTLDNTDPRQNGREYYAYAPPLRRGAVRRAIGLLTSLSEDYTPAEAYTAVEKCLALLYPDAKIGEDQKSFWKDAAFLQPYRRLAGDNNRPLERKYTVYQLLRSLQRVQGDIAECGVYNGSTAYFMALANEESGISRNLYLYDSFEGLSPPVQQDGSYWRGGDLACSEDVARQNLASFQNVHFLCGWIPTRFGEAAHRTFCFVHIDVDLYEPTRDSIEFFFPRLQPGGMLICDDYGFESCPGARLAMDQFFSDKSERIIHLPTGQGLVIKI